jgi:hypothetical protein
MLYSPFASLRTRLLSLAVLASIPLLVLALYNLYAQRQNDTRVVQNQTLDLAYRTVVSQRDLIGSAYQLLLPLTQLPVVRGQDPVSCNTFFAQWLGQHRAYLNIGSIDANGKVICAGNRPDALLDLSQRPYFARLLSQQVTFG